MSAGAGRGGGPGGGRGGGRGGGGGGGGWALERAGELEDYCFGIRSW